MAAKNRQTTRVKTKPSQAKPNDRGSPLEQAITSAAVISLAVGALAFVFKWSIDVPLVAFAISLCGFWFWRLKLFDAILFQLETVTQSDLNADSSIGKPSHLVVTNANRAKAKTASQVQQSKTNNQLTELQTFIERCYTVGTSESAQGIKPNNRAAYLQNKDVLFRLGIAANKSANPKAGWKMTVDRDTALQIVADHITST